MAKRLLFTGLLLLGGLLVVQFGGLTPAVEAQEEGSTVADMPPVHDFHVNDFGLECTDCHNLPESPAPGQELSFSVRPGHSNCDACHEDIFEEGELVSFCMVCHEGEVYDLSPFPSGQNSLAVFSHTQHVDPQGRVNRQTGMRQDCTFCHAAEDPMAGVSLPAHPQCVACHGGAEAVSPMLSVEGGNEGCLGCHNLTQMDENILAEAMSMTEMAEPMMEAAHSSLSQGESYEEVLPFPHGSHVETLDGMMIQCETCHESVLERASLDLGLELPAMTVCASCHDSAAKVGKDNKTENCSLCHSEIREDLVPELAELVAPVAHTPSFLRDHEMQAHESADYCNFCHDLTHSAGSDNCADCHSIMQPESHLAVRFNETTHGRLAAMDREQCATCHVVDFCSSCHNLPPRSHNPLPLFAGGGLHRDLAAFNLRSCLTCHTYEDTCSQCHAQTLRVTE